MKRVLVVSDTHGRIEEVERLLENVKFDIIIHLGDTLSDAIKLKERVSPEEFYMVKGNNDFYGETHKTIEICSHKIFICHGHTYGVSYGLENLAQESLEKGAKIALYGHTHTMHDEIIKGVRVFCPGSPSRPRGSERSVGIIECDDSFIELAHYEMRGWI